MNTICTPPFDDFPVMKNKRITLRQILDRDMDQLVEISFYDSIQARTVEEAITMNRRIDQDYYNGNSIHWGIVDNRTNKIIGSCGYYRGFDKEAGELGCVLLHEFRGKGFMTSSLALAIDFGKTRIGLKRIWAATHKENENAIKLLERLDFSKISESDDHSIEFELDFIENPGKSSE